MTGVTQSGTDVNQMVTVPADITFTITDDDVALELDEMYPLVIIPDDTTVTVEPRLANIIIEDNVDSKSLSQFVVQVEKHFFEMKGDVRMAGANYEKGATTTTNTIPTSFVGTAHPWVYVKDVGMEYDVFVVVVVLLPSLFIICTSHPYITLNFEEMFFLYLFH